MDKKSDHATSTGRDGRTSERQDRINKLNLLKENEINPYPAKAERDFAIAEILAQFEKLQKSGKQINLVGRLRSLREHGNLIFADLEDGTGRIQLAISKKNIGDEQYKLFLKTIDIGDFLQASGKVFLTHTSQKSLEVTASKILTKTLRPIPAEHFGLQDEEEKLRKRYLDILLNADLKEMIVKRAKFWNAIRNFLAAKGFQEVETPVLETTTGGADARPFATHHNALDIDLYLRISMGELWQKRLMVVGLKKHLKLD
ncbi:MAG: amino acid--tRNA ligase-related protein, partial [Patescibacteria group bacterium]